MDHEHARLLMLFHRPGGSPDLAAEEALALESHLTECPACMAVFRNRSAADARIATALKAVPVPAGPKAGLIRAAVNAANADSRRSWVRTAVGATAATLAVVVGVSGYNLATRPRLDPDALAIDSEFVAEQPDRAARDWLTANRLPLPDELPLNLQQVRFRGEVGLNGRPAPALLLAAPTGQTAWVYFLSPGRFDTSAAGNAQASVASVRYYNGLPGGWSVMVVYTGNDIRPFLRADAVAFN